MPDKQIDPIGWRDAKIAELEAAIREFACTGTDEPCGCYRLLSQERTEIARLQLANKQSMEMADARSIENVGLKAENEKLRATLNAKPTPEAILLQARKPDGGEWIDIFPAQLGWMAQAGLEVRALD